jgi:hypothetical protein
MACSKNHVFGQSGLLGKIKKYRCPDKLRHATIPRNWKNQAVPQYVRFTGIIFLFFHYSNNQKHFPQILNIIIKSSWNETLLTSKKVKLEICKIRWVWFSNRILIIATVKSIKNLYFRTTLFLAGAPFSNLWCYSRFSVVDLTIESLLSNHLVEKLLLDDLINCFNVSTFNGL